MDGTFSQKWNYYQKTEGRAVAYVQRYIGFYCLQVYERGQLGVCDIEYRTENFQEAVDKALEFLEVYKDKNKHDMAKDYWSPSQYRRLLANKNTKGRDYDGNA